MKETVIAVGVAKPKMGEIPIPEGLEIPADTGDGDEFEALTTYRKEGNKLCPIRVDGIELMIPGKEEEDEDEDSIANETDIGLHEEEDDFADHVMKAAEMKKLV